MKIEVLLTDKECRLIKAAINQRIFRIDEVLDDGLIADTKRRCVYEKESADLEELRNKLDSRRKATYEVEQEKRKKTVDELKRGKKVNSYVLDLFENLCEAAVFTDLDETKKAVNEFDSVLSGAIPNAAEAQRLITDAAVESEYDHEKQGFYYGFTYAMKLIFGDKENVK